MEQSKKEVLGYHTLKSAEIATATIHSMVSEGPTTPKFYKRTYEWHSYSPLVVEKCSGRVCSHCKVLLGPLSMLFRVFHSNSNRL